MIQHGKPPHTCEWSLPGGMQELGGTVREAAFHRNLPCRGD
jgi:ADP-ribose pyrophosphatase YjhB (NUDIX family)